MLGLKWRMMASPVPAPREVIRCGGKKREFESGTCRFEPHHCYLSVSMNMVLSFLGCSSLSLCVTSNAYIMGLFHIYISSDTIEVMHMLFPLNGMSLKWTLHICQVNSSFKVSSWSTFLKRQLGASPMCADRTMWNNPVLVLITQH